MPQKSLGKILKRNDQMELVTMAISINGAMGDSISARQRRVLIGIGEPMPILAD